MSKVKLAKFSMGAINIIAILMALAVAGVILWLLWLWAVAHPISFFPIVGVIVVVGLIIGLVELYSWSERIIEKDKEEEQIAQYENKYGVKPDRHPHYGIYAFNEPPREWRHSEDE